MSAPWTESTHHLVKSLTGKLPVSEETLTTRRDTELFFPPRATSQTAPLLQSRKERRPWDYAVKHQSHQHLQASTINKQQTWRGNTATWKWQITTRDVICLLTRQVIDAITGSGRNSEPNVFCDVPEGSNTQAELFLHFLLCNCASGPGRAARRRLPPTQTPPSPWRFEERTEISRQVRDGEQLKCYKEQQHWGQRNSGGYIYTVFTNNAYVMLYFITAVLTISTIFVIFSG